MCTPLRGKTRARERENEPTKRERERRIFSTFVPVYFFPSISKGLWKLCTEPGRRRRARSFFGPRYFITKMMISVPRFAFDKESFWNFFFSTGHSSDELKKENCSKKLWRETFFGSVFLNRQYRKGCRGPERKFKQFHFYLKVFLLFKNAEGCSLRKIQSLLTIRKQSISMSESVECEVDPQQQSTAMADVSSIVATYLPT